MPRIYYHALALILLFAAPSMASADICQRFYVEKAAAGGYSFHFSARNKREESLYFYAAGLQPGEGRDACGKNLAFTHIGGTRHPRRYQAAEGITHFCLMLSQSPSDAWAAAFVIVPEIIAQEDQRTRSWQQARKTRDWGSDGGPLRKSPALPTQCKAEL